MEYGSRTTGGGLPTWDMIQRIGVQQPSTMTASPRCDTTHHPHHPTTCRCRPPPKNQNRVFLPASVIACLPESGFCLVFVLPYPGGGVGLAEFQGGWVSNPPPPQGGVGLCGGPWVYRASATSFFLLLQVPCNMFIYGVFTCHCISRVHAPRP